MSNLSHCQDVRTDEEYWGKDEGRSSFGTVWVEVTLGWHCLLSLQPGFQKKVPTG